MTVQLQYTSWGITLHGPGHFGPVSRRVLANYYYPVGTRGPVDSPTTERKAINHCQQLGGEVKGPFFYKA